MADSNAPSSAPTTPTAAGFEAEAETLRKRLELLRQAQAAGRWQLIVTSALIVAMFGVFMGATYSRIQGNFNAGAIQQAAGNIRLSDSARSKLLQAGQNALPTYRDVAMQRFHDQAPQIAASAQARFDTLPAENGQIFQTKLQAAFDRAVKRIEPDVKSAFPSLSDEQRQSLMQNFAMQQIDTQNKQVAGQVTQLYTNDLIQLHTTLDKLKLPDAEAIASKDDTNAMERDFLHSALMLADNQVTNPEPSADAIDVAAVTKRPATQPAPQDAAAQ